MSKLVANKIEDGYEVLLDGVAIKPSEYQYKCTGCDRNCKFDMFLEDILHDYYPDYCPFDHDYDITYIIERKS